MTMRYHHSLAGTSTSNRRLLLAAALVVEVLLMMMPAQQVLAFVVPAQKITTTIPPLRHHHHDHPCYHLPLSPASYEHTTTLPTIIRSRRSTQLHATPGTLGMTMSRLASSFSSSSSSLGVRIAAVFVTGFFGLWWFANKALKKHSIKFDGGSSCSCPLFQTTTSSAPAVSSDVTTTSQSQQHGFSGFTWPPTWWSSSDMRLAALQLLGRRPMIRLQTKKLISEILVDKEFIQTLALPTHTNGLIATTDGNRHAYLRRLLEQAFCPQTALHEALPAIQQVTSRCWESKILQQQQSQQSQSGDDSNSSKSSTTATMMQQMDLHDISLDCVLDTILCHYLGYPIPTTTAAAAASTGGQEDDNDKDDLLVLKEILKTFTGVYEHGGDNNKKKLRFLPWAGRRRSRRQEQETKKQARVYLKEKIKSQMMTLRQQNTNDNDQTASSSSSVLSQLIWAKETTDFGVQTLTDEEILDSMLGLIVAATSSTTQVITTAMEWLGRHPKHYAQLVEEQQRSSQQQQQLNYDMLDEHHAPILNAVVEEVLRLHSSNTDNLLSPRLVTEEIELSTGQTIRKGWLVKLEQQQQQSSTADIPQDNNNKEDDEEEKSASAASLSPFGEGPRACLGQSLAIVQIKVFLVMLARYVDSYEIVEVGNRSISSGSSTRMDKVILNNNNTRGGILLPVGGGVEEQQQQQNEAVSEYTTTATASWMRDALETSPNAFE